MSAAAAEPLPPEEVVATTDTRIVEIVAERRDALKADRRALNALVVELLRPQFDLDTTCRLILGAHWKTATPEQRQRFVVAFQDFLVASYGHALLHFTPRTLVLHPQQDPLVGPSTQVHTTMTLTSGDTYPVDFYMRLDGRGWRVVDVLVEGVSYLRGYRSDFGLEIRGTGLDALNARLEAYARDKLAEAN